MDLFEFHPKVCGRVRNRCGRYDSLMIPDQELDAIPEILSCTSVTMAQLLHWCMSRTDEGRIRKLDPMLAILHFFPPKLVKF